MGGILSVALAVGSHRPGVTWHPALWSPDFPPSTGRTTEGQRLSNRLPTQVSLPHDTYGAQGYFYNIMK